MVSETSYRSSPEYSLTRIRELARAGCIDYGTRNVLRDIENLSYTPEDVHKCLETLNECHFRQAVRYSENGPWFDVFHVMYRGPTGDLDELYIKLKLNRDCIVVILQSFHRKRYD